MSERRWPARVLPAAAIAAAIWSLLPFSAWWDGADLRYFRSAWETWFWGTVVTLLAFALLLALARGAAARIVVGAWRWIRALEEPVFVGACSLLLAALALLCTLLVFSGNPRNVDGFAQLFQARMFLAGRAWLAPPQPLASFATLQMIIGPDRWYSQYPPGQPALLAIGLAAGAWYLLNPALAIAFAVACYRVARWCADESTARLTLLLLLGSPFVIAVAGSEMNHLGAAVLGVAAAAAAVGAAEAGDRRRIAMAALAGLLLGLQTAFRPLDAVAAAVPVAVILIGWGRAPVRLLAATCVAGIVGTVPTLWFNAATTGSWHLFGYTVLWGPQHSLGFHPVPFGTPLTLPRAIARTGMDLHQLNTYLMDSTIPVLVLVAAGFAAGRRQLVSRDALPFAGAAALSGLLFFYWHRDVFYGPRFLFSAVAWYVILLARALVLLRRSSGDRAPGLLAATFGALSIAVGLVFITPGRVAAYRGGTPIFSLHPDRDAQAANIHHAVVVIPDGWGTRLITRMWQAGVPVRRSNHLYAAIDACTLEEALDAAEREAGARTRLAATLDSLAALGRPGQRAGVTADENLRLSAGDLPPVCALEVEVDRRGFYQYAPFLYLNNAALDGDVVWARDLGPGNEALMRRYAGRRFYRYAPARRGGAPEFFPFSEPGW